MRIVLDANILVRAFTRPQGLAGRLLHAVIASSHILLLSNEILAEVTSVLRQPRLANLHGQSESAVFDFAEFVRSSAAIVPITPLIQAPIRDPKDIMVVQTAVTGSADVLCTLDRDFSSPPASAFLAKFSIQIMTDVQLMQRLRQ